MIIQNNDPYREPSFTLKNRIKRQLWNMVWLFLFRPSPRLFHIWRIFLLRLFGAKIGTGCHIYPSVKIWAPWNLILGNFIGIADDVILYCMDVIEIGDYAVISQGSHLCGGTHDYNSKNMKLIAKPIIIGEYSWICAEVFIHAGVVIPEGAVMGARTVVNKSPDLPWTVYSGNPYKQVATRNHNE